MSTFYDLGFISSMCKILWKKWLKYFCWSDEASDRSWDDSESDTPDHSTRAGLGWAGLGWTLTRHYPQFFICRNCIRMFTKLCLACPCPTIQLSTLLSAISSPGPWLVLYPPPQSVTCVLAPSFPLTFTSDTDWGPAITFPSFLHLLSSLWSNFAKMGCDFDRNILYLPESWWICPMKSAPWP